MKYTIKNRWTMAAQCEVEIECSADASECVKLGLAVRAAIKADVNLAGSSLAGVNLARADLAGANLTGANLTGANLTGANLTGADLTGADLTGADLAGVNLARADLAGADLTGANLAGVNLARADLAGADLTGADLTGANLARVNLAGAYLARVNLAGAEWRSGITITRPPLQLYGLAYAVTILDAHMQVGCELHAFDEWDGFDDERISRMDGVNARRFWRDNKAALMLLCRSREVKAESKEEEAA